MRRIFAVLLTLVAVFGAGWLSLRRPDIPYDTLESAYSSADSRYMNFDEARKVHYRDQGLRDGPVLVLVHGFSASLHTWEPWVQLLDDDYRIISLDLPGHGLTRGFVPEDVNIANFGNVIDAVTAELGIETFTLVGSSMGGNTAWNYALGHQARLDGLVLVGASGWPASAEDSENTPLVFKLLANPVARTLMRDLDNSSLIRSGLQDSFANPALADEGMIQRYSALNRAPGHRAAILHIMADRDGRVEATPEALQALTVPTLILHGRQDNLVPFAGGEAFAAAIPNATLVAYDNVGHIPHEEVALQSAEDLHAFITGLRTPIEESVDLVEETDTNLP